MILLIIKSLFHDSRVIKYISVGNTLLRNTVQQNHLLGAGGRTVNSLEWSRNQLIGDPVITRIISLKKRKLTVFRYFH